MSQFATPTRAGCRRQFSRHLLHGIAALSIASLLLITSQLHSAPAVVGESIGQPNIVLILADDLGWADLGCYGNKIYRTPNLDQLAAEGLRFTDAYAASSVCSPTRASIQSGKYPARLDLTLWLNGKSPAHAKLLDAPHAKQLPLKEVTIAESLRTAGYVTASIGKWHLGDEPYYPQHQGYDLNVGGTASGSPAGGYFLLNKMTLPRAQQGEYLTDHLTDEAIRFIGANHKRPFFLYQAYHSVHTPIQGKPDLVQTYRDRMEKAGRQFNPAYAAMVHSLDENVGRIVAALDEHGIAEDTVVLFFSDNGGYHRVTDNAPLRAGKGYSYEGGHREPLIVRYPRLITAGGVCREPVVSTDFYPTMLELAGLPPSSEQHIDGVSLVRLFDEPAASLDREAIYWHYPHYSPQGGTPSGAIRQGDWKLIEFFEDGRLELYNLRDDLSEEHDQAAAMPEKVEALHAKLLSWRREVDAKMPAPNPNAGKRPPPARTSRGTQIMPSESFPGFDVLSDVEMTEVEMSESAPGYQLRSHTSGFALQKLAEPVRRASFKLQMRTRVEAPHNGFFVFGDVAEEAKLIKCGVFIGGNYAAIYEGTYPSSNVVKLPMELASGETYDVEVSVDLDAATVEMTVGGGNSPKKLSKRLSRRIEAIRYRGYSIVWTETAFGKITQH